MNSGHFLNEYYGFHKHIEVYNRKTEEMQELQQIGQGEKIQTRSL